MGKIIILLIGILVGCLLVALVRTLLLPRKVSTYALSTDEKRIAEYANKLSKMIQVETISRRDCAEVEKFRNFHRLLEQLFPSVFAHCEKTEIDGNLLLRWKGKSEQEPILLMSHMDVVEANGDWRFPPFSGTIAEGKIWGRGSADTKCSLMAILQSIEELIKDGYLPICDVYVASGCTEETIGDGAIKLVRYLKEKGVRPFLVCDEGGSVIQDPIPGVKGHFAAVGIFEKGYGDVKFIARSKGGHASAPGRNTPIARLAKFVNHVETHNPFRVAFSPAVNAMFTRLAPYADAFYMRFILHNLWLFRPLLRKVMPMISAQGAAMLQTTIAFTMQSGSQGYNVLPQTAEVCANMRFIPHQGTEESLDIISKLARKYSLETEVIYKGEPSNSLDLNGEAFALIQNTIQSCFPQISILPYVVTGGTDAKFYDEICENCVRFSPVNYGPEQLAGMHGLNENLEIGTLPGAVDYYKAIIKAQEGRKK